MGTGKLAGYRCFIQNSASQHSVHSTPGLCGKCRLSFSRSGQGSDREPAVCLGVVKQVTLRTHVGKRRPGERRGCVQGQRDEEAEVLLGDLQGDFQGGWSKAGADQPAEKAAPAASKPRQGFESCPVEGGAVEGGAVEGSLLADK